MKRILCLAFVVNLYCFANAQHLEQQQITHTIADMENGIPVLTDYSTRQLKIEDNINWLLDLDGTEINLENRRVYFTQDKGWVLEYEFETPTQAGIYKEFLRKIDGKLIINEYRQAKMAIASNCSKIVFTESDNNCSCAVKRNSNLESEVTFRLFSSTN